MRDREETLRLLRDGFLWDGEIVWFDFDGHGSIANGSILEDYLPWDQRLAADFLCFYERALADGVATAFSDAVIETLAQSPLNVCASPERLLADFLNVAWPPATPICAENMPQDVMAKFQRECGERLADYEDLLTFDIEDRIRLSEVRKLTPADFFCELDKAIPGRGKVVERWPHVARELDSLGITIHTDPEPTYKLSHGEMRAAIREALDNVYGQEYYDLLSESRDMTASSEKLDADSARGEDVRDAPETSERG